MALRWSHVPLWKGVIEQYGHFILYDIHIYTYYILHIYYTYILDKRRSEVRGGTALMTPNLGSRNTPKKCDKGTFQRAS